MDFCGLRVEIREIRNAVERGFVSGVIGPPQNLPTTLRYSPNFSCPDPSVLRHGPHSESPKTMSSVAADRRGKMTTISSRVVQISRSPKVDDTPPSTSLP